MRLSEKCQAITLNALRGVANAVVVPSNNPAQEPPLQVFINQWDKTIRYFAYQEAKRWGFQIPFLDFEDLIHHGYLHLITLYRTKRIDWGNPGVNQFLRLSLAGHLKNILKSLRVAEESALQLSSVENRNCGTEEISDWPKTILHEDSIVMRSIVNDIQEFLSRLTSRDLMIFMSRFLDGRSLEATARVLTTSRETVRRREKVLLIKIQQFLEGKGWEPCDIKEFL